MKINDNDIWIEVIEKLQNFRKEGRDKGKKIIFQLTVDQLLSELYSFRARGDLDINQDYDPFYTAEKDYYKFQYREALQCDRIWLSFCLRDMVTDVDLEMD